MNTYQIIIYSCAFLFVIITFIAESYFVYSDYKIKKLENTLTDKELIVIYKKYEMIYNIISYTRIFPIVVLMITFITWVLQDP